MSQHIKTHGGNMDSLKWIIVFFLIAMGTIGNYQYSEEPLVLRVLAIMVLAAVTFAIAFKTQKGQKFWQFALEAKTELKKVVWPNRQETVQTTFMVLAIVAIVGLILWGIDAFLLKAIAWLIGYGA